MASGASSLDGNETQGNISHSFIPGSERNVVTLPTIPIPIDFESINQNSGYDKQSSGNYPTVKPPPPTTTTFDNINPSYDSLNPSSQYDKQPATENFKQQCDKALVELKTVRRQHSETSRRCEHAMKELDYFRSQHKAAMSQLEVSNQESSNLRGKYGELLNDKQRLEREVQRLQEGIPNQNNGMCVNVNNGEPGDTALMHTLRKYDGLKEEYDCLRKRYDEIISNHNATADQLQVLQEENSRLKSQSHEITQERNSVIRERNGLKQQCTAAIRQWDLALRERNDYRDALGKVSSQHEEAVREMNQAMGVRVKATKDIKRLTEERNAAMHEYSLIMSERDTVHKEMEKLSEDLQRAVKRAQVAETELASAQRERHALALQAESLRREIASALLDRDRALKECSDLTRNAAQNQPNSSKMRLDSSSYHHGHSNSGAGKDATNGGQLGSDTNMDKLQGLVGMVLNPRHKERVDNLETANQELDRLRKTIDKLQSELNEALQEAEVSKRRRDWAFSERDKIVSERESIRTLCDRLRKERDRAVSDLAEALRDSDDIKKQRNEASKELKQLKEKLETELEKDNTNCRVHSPIAHNHSHDSAIDSDLQEWESEILEVDLAGIPANRDVGFELVGGREDPYYPNDSGIYVASIQKGSVADGKLKIGDCIIDCADVSSVASASHIVEALRSNGGRARLWVRRRHARSRGLHTIQLNRSTHADHGLTLEQGIYISKITPGSLAAKEGSLAIGDRVLSINNMDGLKTAVEAMMVLNDRRYDILTITTLKHISHSGSTNSDLSNRFSPTKETFNKNPYVMHGNKMINSCSQTEEPWCQYVVPAQNQKIMTSHPFDSSVYKVSNTTPVKSHEKSHSSSGGTHEKGTWNIILDAVTGRSKPKDKQNRQSVVPDNDTIAEIAELDSVLESYHGKSLKDSSSGSVLKRSTKRRSKENSQDTSDSSKNRGTWPKARSNVIIQQNPTGTIVQSRSKKERPDLSILVAPSKLQQSEQQWSNRNSNPIPNAHVPSTQASAPSRHSVYNKSSDYQTNQTLHFSKPVPLSVHNSFSPPSIGNYEKMRSIEKEKHLPEFVEHDMTSNRLSRNLNPSDDSLDYQTVIRDGKSPNSLDFISTSNKGPSSLEYVPPLPSLTKNQNSLDFALKNHNKDMMDYYTVKKNKNTNNKYSDNESIGPECMSGGLNMGNTLPSHSRLLSLYRGNVVPPFVNPHPHHLPTRYPHPASPPLPMTQSQSGESIGVSYDIPPYAAHSHNVSDIQSHIRNVRTNTNDHYHHHVYEGGTFPRKKENQRFRIPSNPSVTSKNSAGKVSTGSIERSSERGSPMPTFHVEVLSPGRGAHTKQLPHTSNRNSMPEYCSLGWPNKPLPGELRRVHIDKIQQPLGIQISCPPESGGVFVSTVNEHSVASQVGLQVGDQLLEVCGINMRSATYELAANVLRQCGNSITMLVQYSPDKYNEFEGSGSSSQGEGSGDEASVSGSPTPRNSPGPQQSLRLDSAPVEMSNSRQNQNNKDVSDSFLVIEMRKGSDLGISLVGGNAVGIFVHSVQIDSPAYKAGLRTGDQILEYNNTDLRQATAERAALELAKPADKVTVLVRHDLQRYHEIKDKPGDGFFIRAGFDRTADLATNGGDSSFDSCSLCFRRDQVIFVDNTLFSGAPGLWGAWNLDPKGNKLQWGTIPSKFKVEELLRRSVGSLEGGEGSQSRRSSTVVRRSFFRRKKQRDPKELASFSNTNLGWWSDSGTLNEELTLCTYQRVERLSYSSQRPVVVLGPLWECVVEKLVTDFPNEFCRATSEPTQLNGPNLERALAQGKYLEPRKRGHYLECISLQSIKDACDKGIHILLDIGVASIEKLHKQQIYPIILLIKFKSTKQIKEVKDTRYPMEKVSAKAAKEMYEHALKLETEYKQYISAEIAPAGINIAYICTQIKAAVDEEQGKPLWVPSQQT